MQHGRQRVAREAETNTTKDAVNTEWKKVKKHTYETNQTVKNKRRIHRQNKNKKKINYLVVVVVTTTNNNDDGYDDDKKRS